MVNCNHKEKRMKRIGVLGAGTWGIALARLLEQNGHQVTIWSALSEEIDALVKNRIHPNLLGVKLPETLIYTKELQEACENKDVIVIAVPSVFVRNVARLIKEFVNKGQIIVDVAKGIETNTHFTMSQIIHDELGKEVNIVALSGPTHAEEVARNMPTTIVAACTDLKIAELVQDIFMNSYMRVYTNSDVLGVEISGAIKNIIALAAGISDGLGYGDNAKAALITRGSAEITRLGIAMGCMERTFFGLAGVGDLIVTATSKHSRNHKAGYLLGKGYSVENAKQEVGMVVEGINALPAVVELSKIYNVKMPIVEAVNKIINEEKKTSKIAELLMTREKNSEV